MKNALIILAAIILPQLLPAQQPGDQVKTTGFPRFPAITNTGIPGAPLLGQPELIKGTQNEIRTEKHGLAYPAFFDWNHDGKIDLLLGEFETGEKGSYIKVYLNEGTNKAPRYSGKFFYATDTKGDTITAYQWCCIGIHPRFVDLDQDGYVDILTGQYNPGQISWWRGSKDGFQPRQFVDQVGHPEGPYTSSSMDDEMDTLSNGYWNYTSAGFGDFNGDGLTDLFIGGFGELKVSLNIGTKEHPRFGRRKYLLGVDGLPLSIVPPGEKEIADAKKRYTKPHYSGVYKSFITPVDWDGDGVLDLLVTHLYDERDTKDPVVFFRGVQTDKGLRFEPARPLFTAKEVAKTFPGCQPNIVVTDYNHDGVPDLVIGLSLPTINGFNIDSMVAWSYLHDLRLESPGKDAGRIVEWEGGMDKLIARVGKDSNMKKFVLGKLNDYKYLTLRHRGYVYVMLGRRNPEKAVARQGVIAQDEFRLPLNQQEKNGGNGKSLSYEIKSPALIRPGSSDNMEVDFHFQNGWYGYAGTAENIAAGWIPTKVEFSWPDGFEPVGGLVVPDAHPKGSTMVFSDNVKFAQKFKVNWQKKDGTIMSDGESTVGVTIQYQTCDEHMCLPPVTEKAEMKVRYGF